MYVLNCAVVGRFKRPVRSDPPTCSSMFRHGMFHSEVPDQNTVRFINKQQMELLCLVKVARNTDDTPNRLVVAPPRWRY